MIERRMDVFRVLLLMLSLTPAIRCDCVASYTPSPRQLVGVSTTGPLNHRAMAEMCNSQYPGFTLLASPGRSQQAAALCSGCDVPLAVSRDDVVTWATNMTYSQDSKAIRNDLQNSSLAGTGTVGAMNSVTGRWHLVSEDYQFPAALCELAPKLHIHDPVYPVSHPSHMTFSISGPLPSNLSATIGGVVGDLAKYIGVPSDNIVCPDVHGLLVTMSGHCLAFTSKTLSEPTYHALQWGLSFPQGAGLGVDYHVGFATDTFTPSCQSQSTRERGGVTADWPHISQGSVAVIRNVATHQLMTRECTSDLARPGYGKWANVNYWDEVWQPCAPLQDPLPPDADQNVRLATADSLLTQFLGNTTSDELPIRARGLDEFLAPLNTYIELRADSDDFTRRFVEAAARDVMVPSLLDAGVHVEVVEMSSVAAAIVEFANDDVNVSTTSLDLTIVNQTSEAHHHPTTTSNTTATPVLLSVSDEFVSNTTRLSIIYINASYGAFNSPTGRPEYQSIFMYLYFTNHSKYPVDYVDYMKFTIRKYNRTQMWHCAYWDVDGRARDVCKMGEQHETKISTCYCRRHLANGYYLLREMDAYHGGWKNILVIVMMGGGLLLVSWGVYMGCRNRSWGREKLQVFMERVLAMYSPDEGFINEEVMQIDE